MKQLVATVHSTDCETLCAALYAAGVHDLALSEVNAYQPRRQPDEIYKGVRYAVNTAARVKLEALVDDLDADAALALIFDVAAVDHVDVLPLERLTRVQPRRAAARAAAPHSLRVVMSPL